jgi:hypothetical protein
MILVCAFPVASMAASLAGRSLVLALAATPQVSAVDPGPATPKEQALIERACPAPKTAAAYDAHQRCLAARLLSLRADFGRDLSRLSTAARGRLDATCSPVQASRGREDYVDCLSAQLALLSTARARATLPVPAGAPLRDPAVEQSSAGSPVPAPQEFSLLAVQPAAALSAAIAVLTTLAFFGVRARRARPVCRVCGVRVPGSGDLCLPCRHEAAEAVRRAAGERAELRRTHEAEERRHSEQEEEQRLAQGRREEAERVRRLDEKRRLEEEARRRDEDARTQADELQRTRAAAEVDAGESIFDPYGALGLVPNAGGDLVRAAYEQARLKYAPDQVAHLGDDAQAHFAAKSRAIERAYKMLAGDVTQSIE